MGRAEATARKWYIVEEILCGIGILALAFLYFYANPLYRKIALINLALAFAFLMGSALLSGRWRLAAFFRRCAYFGALVPWMSPEVMQNILHADAFTQDSIAVLSNLYVNQLRGPIPVLVILLLAASIRKIKIKVADYVVYALAGICLIMSFALPDYLQLWNYACAGLLFLSGSRIVEELLGDSEIGKKNYWYLPMAAFLIFRYLDVLFLK